MTKINIILPALPKYPVGGFKVLFEYANKMAEDYNDVWIYYPKRLKPEKIRKGVFYKFAFEIAKYLKIKNHFAGRWFNLNEKVKENFIYTLEEKYIRDSDVTIATSWETAEWIGNYSQNKGKKLYLIQDFETWSGSNERIKQTWKLPLQKIAIAKWLKKMVNEVGEECIIIRNGLDHSTFGVDINIENRNPAKVSMLYHKLEWKGSNIGIEALKIVKKTIPNLEVDLFSTSKRNDFILDWMNFHEKPKNLRKLYNNSSIFISPSLSEGWGLPRAEAMQCGCATIITNVNGHNDYGTKDEDYLMVNPNNPEDLANSIIKLINNDKLRFTISKSGTNLIQKFTWENSYQQMKNTF
jgi:glycosyltransferase involved in cell wall biosynthesis